MSGWIWSSSEGVAEEASQEDREKWSEFFECGAGSAELIKKLNGLESYEKEVSRLKSVYPDTFLELWKKLIKMHADGCPWTKWELYQVLIKENRGFEILVVYAISEYLKKNKRPVFAPIQKEVEIQKKRSSHDTLQEELISIMENRRRSITGKN